MMSNKIGKICAALVMGSGLSVSAISAVQAAEWDPKKVTIVVSHSLGGGQDRASRALVNVWAKHFGGKLEVLPKPGASGRIGFDYFLARPRRWRTDNTGPSGMAAKYSKQVWFTVNKISKITHLRFAEWIVAGTLLF